MMVHKGLTVGGGIISIFYEVLFLGVCSICQMGLGNQDDVRTIFEEINLAGVVAIGSQ